MEYKREFTEEERKKVYAYNKKTKCGLLSAIVACFPDDVILTEEEKKKYSAAVDLQKNVANIGKQKKSDPQKKQAEKKKAAALPVKDLDADIISDNVNTMAAVPVEVVKDAEIVPADSSDIPQEMRDGVYNCLMDFISLHVELNDGETPEKGFRRYIKDNSQFFGAFCSYVGENYSKKYKVLVDKSFHKYGATRYDPVKVDALSNLYLSYTDIFGVVPMQLNAARFMGVTRQYLKEYKGGETEGATSALVHMDKKISRARELALSNRLSEGRQNPTGAIFVLKNLHGWKDERTIEHTATISAASASDLPRLGGLGLSDE